MQAPTVSTNQNEAALAANNKQEMADSAISKSPVSPQVAVSTITTTDKTSLNEKEQRLADYVSKMDELRKTTGPEGFRLQQTLKAKNIIASLLGDSDKIEENITLGENEIFYKSEESFFHNQNEQEMGYLLGRQAEEFQALKKSQENELKNRESRKAAKKFQRELQRSTKFKDSVIRDQESASKSAKELKTILSEHHNRIEQIIGHTEEKHRKQISQLTIAQERKIQDRKIMLELQIRSMKEDQKNDALKEFQFSVSHQKNLDKKEIDQLRELQTMELRHLKEKMELETRIMEEKPALKASLLIVEQQTTRSQRLQYCDEKDKIEASVESRKIMEKQIENNLEQKRLSSKHKRQQKSLSRNQKISQQKRLHFWTVVCGLNIAKKDERVVSGNTSGGNSGSASGGRSGDASGGPSRGESTTAPPVNQQTAQLLQTAEEAEEDLGTQNQQLEEQRKISVEQTAKMRNNLAQLLLKHQTNLTELKQKQKQEIIKLDESFQTDQIELEWSQEEQYKDLMNEHREQIQQLVEINEHELEMEAAVRGVESKALQERRILNSLLDTVVDGVISIDPIGRIKRFNNAAEKMFGYTAEEIIDQNVKAIMPTEHSEKHDDYLFNYLSTGVKKVIGIGRSVKGLRKDGTFFPLHLAVSEVIEGGLHLFTAIVRDLTEQVLMEEKLQAEEDRQKREMKLLMDNLAVARKKSENLLSQMLPENIADRIMGGEIVKPESYDSCTIFFSNIVGFSDIAASSQSIEIVNLLNDLYTYFDSIIDNHGSQYLVVSGIPQRNGERHASEIADMSLTLLAGIFSDFVVRHMPGHKLQLQIGMHTGPCVTGVVGTKMPRYCLFGDTVNTASRMESAGSPMKIQLSESTFNILKKTGVYDLEKRGEITVKGKGNMTTYWLKGKKGFDRPLPK